MRKLLFIFILISVVTVAFGQRENLLPMKGTSATTDTMRVIKDNQSALMLRSTWQGDLYDSIDTHTDTLQALRADIDAGLSADLSDSITAHRTELNNLHDSIADHRIDIDANLDSIAIHRTELNNAVDSIADHRAEINANTSQISTNGTNISSNSVFIGVNTADIASLEDSIDKHTDTLQLHQTQIAAFGNPVLYGSVDQIPHTNATTDNFDYSANLSFDGYELHVDSSIMLNSSTTPVLELNSNATNAIIEPQTGYGLWVPIPLGEYLAIGPNAWPSTFVIIDDNNSSGFDNTLAVNNSTGEILTVETAGSILTPQLGDDDAEEHFVAIDDATGLLTKRSVESIPGADSTWVSITVDTINGANNQGVELYFFDDTGDDALMTRYISGSYDSYYEHLGEYLTLHSEDGTNTGQIGISPNGVSIAAVGAGGTKTVNMTDDQSLTYSNDYSGGFTNRSLVDKEYVDGLVSGSTDSSWLQIRTDSIYEYTGNNGVDIEGVHFENTNIYALGQIYMDLTGGDGLGNTFNELDFYTNSTLRMAVRDNDILIAEPLTPGVSIDIGNASDFFRNAYIDTLIINENNNKIYLDGSDNLTFIDDNTGPHTLTGLAASGSITDDIFDYDTDKYTPYADGSASDGRFYTYTATAPSSDTVLAYDGRLRVTGIVGHGHNNFNAVQGFSANATTAPAHFTSSVGGYVGYFIQSGAGSSQHALNVNRTQSSGSVSGAAIYVYDNPSATKSDAELLLAYGSGYQVWMNPNISDGASAIAYRFDTEDNLTTVGAKLLSLQNNSSEKFNVDKDGAIFQTVISYSLTDGAPTDAEIDAATGTTPAAVGSGWKRIILDSDGSALMYIIISDGSNWQYTALTIAT